MKSDGKRRTPKIAIRGSKYGGELWYRKEIGVDHRELALEEAGDHDLEWNLERRGRGGQGKTPGGL